MLSIQHSLSWQDVLRLNWTQVERLVDFLELDEENRKRLLTAPSFKLNLPHRLAIKIKKNDLNDPLFRQFIPLQEEKMDAPLFTSDPVGDGEARRAPRLLHKYAGRVLLICTGACAMHCRYCFRQEFSYPEGTKIFAEELQYIKRDPSIHEVLLSGGDPLSLPNRVLEELLNALQAIPHITRIRFHTRFMIGIPERIEEGLLQILKEMRPAIWFVIHANHPLELDQEVLSSFKKLQQAGVHLLHQAVLLKGVNDDLMTLQLLLERLVDHGVTPYYLHQLDRVRGASHFEVPIEEGKKLIHALQKLLPGFAVPKYVQEVAGATSKISL